MVESAFNKYSKKGGNGTLVGNWQEERELRDFTGEGRTITKEHIPKKHHDFDNPIHTDKVFDNTANRIYGESRPEIMTTNNTEYGTAKHSTAGITRIGRKTDMMEREIANAVAKEMQERRDAIAAKQQERYFDTTNAENLTA
jgi:hypothetical protein